MVYYKLKGVVMEMNSPDSSRVQKEEIVKFSFPEEDILSSIPKRSYRQSALNAAMKIGNQMKKKVIIVFEDRSGQKQVNTTVWGLTPNRVKLKGDTFIPLHRVRDVRFF